MKFTKHLISGAAALVAAGTLGVAFAQTSTQPATQGLDKTKPIAQQPMSTQGATGTTDTTNSGTMNSGSTTTMSNDSGTGNRTTTGRASNRRMNADGTMSTELAARADRG